MAKADYIKALLKAYKNNDNNKFEEVIYEIIEEEEKKKHIQVAQDLRRTMEDTLNSSILYHHSLEYIENMPKNNDRNSFLIDFMKPRKSLIDLVVSIEVESSINELVDDHKKGSLLRSYGLEPNKKILFCGPPGCGKTITAEVVASELRLPLIHVRLDAIISSYLGDTAGNLRKVFDYINKAKAVVLFDEFDAIGKERSDESEHGEIKRVVNSFLQMLDSYSGECIVIGATNHQGMLDSAVWRRFDDVVYFDVPDDEQIKKLISNNLRVYPYVGINDNFEFSKLKGLSHADIERICKQTIKYAIKNRLNTINLGVFEIVVSQYLNRIEIYKVKQ